MLISYQFTFFLQRLEHRQIEFYHTSTGTAAFYQMIECQLTIAFIQSYAVWSGRREKGEKHRVHGTSHVDDDIVMGGMYHLPYFPDVFEKAMSLFVCKWD